MSNSFENEQGEYCVMVNEEGQYSLWPAFIKIPEGWRIAHEEDMRKTCLEWADKNWTDMHPKSLIKAIEEGLL